MKVARWASSNGEKLVDVARAVGVSPRTLRHWQSEWMRDRLAPRMRGRRAERLDLKTRTGIIEVLKLMGPRVGMPTLQPIFPEVPRRNGPPSRPSGGKAECPECGSTSIHVAKKGFGEGKRCLGTILAGPLGLLCGWCGANKLSAHCIQCGHRWRI